MCLLELQEREDVLSCEGVSVRCFMIWNGLCLWVFKVILCWIGV